MEEKEKNPKNGKEKTNVDQEKTNGDTAIEEPKPSDKSYAMALIKGGKAEGEIRIQRRRAVMKNGIPVITFTVDEVNKSTIPLKWALIAAFGRFRPNIDDIRKHMNCEWGTRAHVDVSIMDQKHVLLRFSNEQDYMKVLKKENHVVKGIRFNVIQWTVNFDPTKEHTKQVVWIHIPRLPVNFFQEDFLASIATGVGNYITCDNPTKTLSRAQGARVCVEIDLMDEKQKEIVIQWGCTKRVFEIIYENLPDFCKHCQKRGHVEETCKDKEVSNKTKENFNKVKEIEIPSQRLGTNHADKGESTKAWVTRVFQTRPRKLMWRLKLTANKDKSASKIETSMTEDKTDKLINLLQSPGKQSQVLRGQEPEKQTTSTDSPQKSPAKENSSSKLNTRILRESPTKEEGSVNTELPPRNYAEVEPSSNKNVTSILASPAKELTNEREDMIIIPSKVSNSDSGDSVFYDAYLLHRITDPACTFADWKKMQNENFQEVISKKNRKKKTREKEDSISDSEYYDDENCTLADWKKVISKKNKKRLKAREKENSMLEQRDERQKRTIRKPARLLTYLMQDYFMKRGHVPAFGSWEYEDSNTQLPFTQCFESARQAKLFHYAAAYSNRDRDLYVAGDLYQNDHVVTPAVILVPIHRSRGCRQMHVKEGKKQQKRGTETTVNEPVSPVKDKHRAPTPKPVDEDLYKISPDLLSSKPIKKKRTFGLFSSCCLKPTCA